MQRVSNFLGRSVLVLAVVLALNAPAYARGRTRDEPPQPKTPIIKKIVKFFLLGCGDGLITPNP